MTRQPFFDEYFYRRRYRWQAGDMGAHASILSSSLDDRDRAERPPLEEVRRAELVELRLATEALWQRVRDALDLTDDDLRAVMDELDRSDGVVDGKHTTAPRPCPSCGALVPPERPACQFCGAAVGGGSTFS